MNTLNRESAREPLRTSDLAAAASRSVTRDEEGTDDGVERREVDVGKPSNADSERLEPLFSPDATEDYRARWIAVQSSFVDDPRRAVQQGDELVAQVMRNLAESFVEEREKLEEQLGQTGDASTEALRVALRRYRSFFDRLLSL